MLLNIALNLLNLMIELLYSLLVILLLSHKVLLLLFLLLSKSSILANVVLQICLVISKLFGTIDERLFSAFLFFFKLSDFLIDRVISELSKEHFLLLVDELVDILSTLLFGELDTTSSDVHSLMNEVLLFGVEILLLRVVLLR